MKIRSKNLLLGISASLLLFACDKDDNDNSSNTLNTQDRNYILQTSLANTAEVGAGALANTTADDQMVKDFGQQMVTDHTTAQTDLKSLGSDLGVSTPDSVDEKHAKLVDTLKTLSGRAFDSVYIMSQIADHQTVINQFEEEVSSGNKTEVINYANKYLPKLQMHLDMADSIATEMNFK
jgi:putative membrane protein